MEQAGSVIHSTFAIDVIWSGGYEGARNECKKSEIHRGIEDDILPPRHVKAILLK